MLTDEGVVSSMETMAFPSLSCEVTMRRGLAGSRVSDMDELAYANWADNDCSSTRHAHTKLHMV